MNPVQHILRSSLRAYQLLVSPVLHCVCGPLAGCRYTPTCSQYAAQAVHAHGAAQGSWLALRRVCRCHPWGGCGEDPVPPARTSHTLINPSSSRPARNFV